MWLPLWAVVPVFFGFGYGLRAIYSDLRFFWKERRDVRV